MIKFINVEEVVKHAIDLLDDSDLLGIKPERRDNLKQELTEDLSQKGEDEFERVIAKAVAEDIENTVKKMIADSTDADELLKLLLKGLGL